MGLAEKLLRLRRTSGLTTAAAADLLGVSYEEAQAELANPADPDPAPAPPSGAAAEADVTDLEARVAAIESGGGGGGTGGTGAAPDALGITDRVRWLDADGNPAAELWVEEQGGGARELRVATVSNSGRQVEGALSRASDEIDLTKVSNGDTNGLLYYIATNELTEAWQNPISGPAHRIVATTSPLINAPPNVYGPDKAVDRGAAGATDVSQFHTSLGNNPARYTLDLGPGWLFNVQHYTIRSGPDHMPRTWRLQGSNDGSAFTTLKDHSGDTTLNANGAWGGWDVPGTGQSRYLRLEQYGAASSGFDYFSFSEIEFYGKLARVTP